MGQDVDSEWALILGLCAAPFAVFAMIEAISVRRRRREQAIARRSKSTRPGDQARKG